MDDDVGAAAGFDYSWSSKVIGLDIVSNSRARCAMNSTWRWWMHELMSKEKGNKATVKQTCSKSRFLNVYLLHVWRL